MGATWYAILALMLTAWVVLDGFDLGAGMLHLLVADDDLERRTVLAAIGPVWDGNEVWLVASGGILVFAFPRAYAASFSGFYLPLMLVLWLLIGRGLSIELRGQLPHPLWRTFWDAAFALSSTLLALVLGASLGNVVRGVPLDRQASFSAPLFSDFHTGSGGALDWYTLTVAPLALAALFVHGALYLAWKTEGAVHDRATRLARRALPVTALILVLTTLATHLAQPLFFARFTQRPWAWPLPLAGAAALVAIFVLQRKKRDRAAFLASCAFLTALLLSTAAALYPTLLRSTLDPAFDLTSDNAASGHHGLAAGLAWWIPALALAVAYFVYLFKSFSGKVRPDHES